MTKDAIHFYTNRLRGRRNLLVNLYGGLTRMNEELRNRWKIMKAIESGYEEDWEYESDMLKLQKKADELKARVRELEVEQKEDKACLKNAMRGYEKTTNNRFYL